MNRLVLKLLANAAYGFQAKSGCRNMNDLLRFTCTASLRHMNTNRVTSDKLKEYQSLLKKVTIIHKQVNIYSSARKYEWKDANSESISNCKELFDMAVAEGDSDVMNECVQDLNIILVDLKAVLKDRMLNGSESKLSCFVEIVAGVGDQDALYDSRR